MTMIEKASEAVLKTYEGYGREMPDRVGRDIARAVLLAVRDEGLNIYHASDPDSPFPDYLAAEGFVDMIDAILEEPK